MGNSAPSVLVTGARGLIGRYLLDACSLAGMKNIPTFSSGAAPTSEFQSFDLTALSEDEIVRRLETQKVDVVVHLAAQSNVDWCEKNIAECQSYNVALTAKLARSCKRAGSKFYFASTNAVYDGKAAPFSENSALHPLHAYGKSKQEAEAQIKDSGADFVIMRLILSFGWNAPDARENPMTQILSAYLVGKRKLKMVDDVFANTLYAGQAANAIVRAIERGVKGETFNISGATRESRFEFANSVKKVFGLHDLEIEKVSSSAFAELVPRPRDTSFAFSKMEKVLGVRALASEEALQQCLKDRLFATTGWADRLRKQS